MPVFLWAAPTLRRCARLIYKGRRGWTGRVRSEQLRATAGRDGPYLIQYIVPTAGYVFCGGAGGRRNSGPRRGVFAIQIHFWPAPPLYFGKMLNFAADRAKKCTFVHRNYKAN